MEWKELTSKGERVCGQPPIESVDVLFRREELAHRKRASLLKFGGCASEVEALVHPNFNTFIDTLEELLEQYFSGRSNSRRTDVRELRVAPGN